MDLTPEIIVYTSRSSGKGGQHVNKTESKVEIHFNISESNILTPLQKEILYKRLKNKINLNGEISMISQDDRSQFKNKKNVIDRLHKLIALNLIPIKKRLKIHLSAAQKERRLKEKKLRSEKKRIRREKLQYE